MTGETGQRQIDRSGLLESAAGRPRVCRMIRTGARQARVSGIFSIDAQAGTGGAAGRGRNRAGRRGVDRPARSVGRGEIAGLRRQPAGYHRIFAAACARFWAIFTARTSNNFCSTRKPSATCSTDMPEQRNCGSRWRRCMRAWRDAQRKLDDLRRNEQEKLRLLDLWRFQRDEIESRRHKPGEDDSNWNRSGGCCRTPPNCRRTPRPHSKFFMNRRTAPSVCFGRR